MCVCAGVDEWMFKHALRFFLQSVLNKSVCVCARIVFSPSLLLTSGCSNTCIAFSPPFSPTINNRQSPCRSCGVPYVGIPRLLVIRARGVSECSVDAAQQLATHTHGHHFLLTAGATGTSDACGRWAS